MFLNCFSDAECVRLVFASVKDSINQLNLKKYKLVQSGIYTNISHRRRRRSHLTQSNQQVIYTQRNFSSEKAGTKVKTILCGYSYYWRCQCVYTRNLLRNHLGHIVKGIINKVCGILKAVHVTSNNCIVKQSY